MLKSKVKSFLSGFQKDKIQDDADVKSEDIHQMQPTDLPHSRDDPRKTEEIIQEIEDHYFDEGDIDCSQHELEGLGPEIDIAALEDRIFCLKTRDTAVYRKIYDLVFANYTAYVQELENVTMLQVSLQDAAKTCVNARRSLKSAREGVSQGGLGLLGKHRKRERLRSLLDILKTLKTLQRTDARLKVLLEEGDYPAATQLCIECQKAIETYKLFSCVSELSVSLQDVQQDIEQELERALSKVTMKFSAHHYQQVQEAYGILGKTQTAVDTLMMKFTTTIHDQAYAVVAEYVKTSGGVATDDHHLKAPYANLCKLINSEHFIPCLMEICQVFWRIMFSYRQIREWHSRSDSHISSEMDENSISRSVDSAFDRSYVRTKLENGLLRVWRDVQQKVRPYILGLDMSHFKYDDFIRVLDIVNRLISIGVEFCGEGSSSLQESMRQQSLNYFKNYHRARLDELKIFLETEAWELCPVRSTFSLHQLREFRFLKSVTSIMSPKQASQKESSSCFSQYSLDDNPFGASEETEEEVEEIIDTRGLEDTVSDDERNEDEDVSDELKHAYVDEQTGDTVPSLRPRVFRQRIRSSSASRGPLLANTTLTVLRFFGNYMQMMNVLQPIAFDVLECLSQLFDYYLFGVYDFFVRDLECLPDNAELSTKLSTSLKRISENFISPEDIATNVAHSPDDQIKVPKPQVNPIVPLSDHRSLFGLSCRMVAVESL